MTTRSPRLRCALYTRKSSEEGLEQAFNSLHAQREACESYVRSQVSEGWSPLKTLYDDGGFSGGNMDRPALRRLLADIDAGLVDVVVVYKVDRLTRSLGDFGRIIERFDAKGVSFVSVTQAFNTTTSMGRLTLNVLLSFAQFEREVTGERIRDKITASKKKGMWMAGTVPFGYDAPTDLQTRALVVNEVEADQVRHMFSRYLEIGSVHQLVLELRQAGALTKLTVSKKGKSRGGVLFSRGPVYHLLRNRVYVGDIVHKDEVYPGNHPSIVDRSAFDAVQSLLDSHVTQRKERPTRSVFALTGRIFDAAGAPMSPNSNRGRGGQLYRYYVSAPLQQGLKPKNDYIRRVPAEALEALLQASIVPLLSTHLIAGLHLRTVIRRVEIHAQSVVLTLKSSELDGANRSAERQLDALLQRLGPGADMFLGVEPETVRLTLDVRVKFRGGRTWLVRPKGGATESRRKVDPILLDGLRSSHAVLRENGLSPHAGDKLTASRALASTYLRRLAKLGLLAPDLQQMVIEGRQPEGLRLDHLIIGPMPLAWADQRRWFEQIGG